MRIFPLILLFFALQTTAQPPAVVADYIANFRQYAINEQVRTGIPAAITMAQGIHESGAGQGDLALKSNNHFGIKCKTNWNGDRIYHDDDETGECFRAYSCVADSYRDHSDFIKTGTRYSFLFDIDPEDYTAWANGLKKAGYATNPQYPKILIRIIEENNLEILTESAMAQAVGNGNNIWISTASKTASAQPNSSNDETKSSGVPKNDLPVKQEKAPQSIVKINHCNAVFAVKGSSLKALAAQYHIRFSDLIDYNDMKPADKLGSNQVIFLEEKRKKGNHKTHEVQQGESAWIISQQEGIRLDKLLQYNRLASNFKLKTGRLLYLRENAPH